MDGYAGGVTSNLNGWPLGGHIGWVLKWLVHWLFGWPLGGYPEWRTRWCFGWFVGLQLPVGSR